jgi:hypothetical protein
VTGRLALAATSVATLAAVAFPSAAHAHGFVGRQDLPIPRLLFVWAAFAVLVASFVGLAVLWPKPRLEGEQRERRVLVLPQVLSPLLGLLGVALFALVVYAGLAGTQTPTANLAPTAVYVLFWVGPGVREPGLRRRLPAPEPVAARWAARSAGRPSAWRAPGCPRRCRTPSASGAGRRARPARVRLARARVPRRGGPERRRGRRAALRGVQLLGMSLYGVEAWTRNGDAFGVYFGHGRPPGPARLARRELWLRPFLSGATGLLAIPGTVAVLTVLIGTTSFDGFSQGPTWNAIAPDLQGVLSDAGSRSRRRSSSRSRSAWWVSCSWWQGCTAWASSDALDRPAALHPRARRALCHTLLPIALAYVIAHYFSYLTIQGQAIGYLASDPLGTGTNLLGTPPHRSTTA